MNQLVSFNVGGTKYQVSHSLLETHSNSMIAKSASKEWHADPTAEIFIDRDGMLFRHVLNYLRDGKVDLPVTVSKNAILNELQFYGIDCDSSSIRVSHQASAFSAMAVNKLIESLEKDEHCLRFTKLCIDMYKIKGRDSKLQFFVRHDSADRPLYVAAESVSEGGLDMLERCNRFMGDFGIVLKAVTAIEVLKGRPKYCTLLEVP